MKNSTFFRWLTPPSPRSPSAAGGFSAERVGTAALQEANPTMPDDEKGGAADEDKNIEIWKIKKLIKSLEAARG